MMKFIYTIIFGLLSFFSFAQSNCDSIKKENENLKKLLNLYNDHKPSKFENLEVKYFRAIGDIKKQIVTVEFLIKNIDAINGDYYVDKVEVIDEFNTSKQLSRYGFGSNFGRDADLLSNVEQKYTCIVERVTPSTMSNVKYITFTIINRAHYMDKIIGKIDGDKIEWK